MQCERIREFASAYIDGELHGDERQAVAAHLGSCPNCGRHADELSAISRQLAALGRETMPADLESRIRARLDENAGSDRRPFFVWTAWRQQAAALAAGCILTALVAWVWIGVSDRHASIEHDVVTAHIRSLLQESPIHIASADTHTVKPWFAGRVDFAPAAKDLTAEGFMLMGGRVDYVGERRVGALVYKRRQHLINVFVWPAAGAEQAGPRALSPKGFSAVVWSKGGMTYWAISDLNAGELMQLPALL